MNSKKILLPLMAMVLVMASCSKKPDIEYTNTYKMAGEWFIKYYYDGDELTDFNKILSYNTSDPNSNQVWVDDLGLWPFKAKFNVDYSNLLFTLTANAANEEVTGETVKVIEGKILPGLGHSRSGNVVDSIYLKLEFSDDPGNVYEIRGHGRTGFFEDEY